MHYSIREAAEAAGVSKSTIQRRLKAGELSKSGNGKIDRSELARLYPDSVKVSHEHSQYVPDGTDRDTSGTHVGHPEIKVLEAQLEALNQLAAERAKTIEDLRDRLDKEGEERRKLTAMLTDQRPAQLAPKRGLWARITGS